MRYKNDVKPEDYDSKNRELHGSIDNGELLTSDEQAFVCHCLRFENLLLYPFCLDEFYSRTFIFRNFATPPGMYPLKERDHIYYEGLVREWEGEMYKTNHFDRLIQIVAKETRDELKNLRKRYKIFHRTFSSSEYQHRKFKLLEWSRYRYIMIKDVFELSIKSDHCKLFLNGQEIIFDYYSLTRHYGHIMKPYETDKSHFTQDVHHEQVHLELEKIFAKIDGSKVYTNQSIKDINIRLNGTLYKIYIDEETKGAAKILRLNTFFPIVNPNMLAKLENEFQETILENSLSVLVKKNGS